MVARAKYGYPAKLLEREAHAIAVGLAPGVLARISARPLLPHAPRKASLLRYEMIDGTEWVGGDGGESDERSDGCSTTCDRLSINDESASPTKDSDGGVNDGNKRETARRNFGNGSSDSDSRPGNSDNPAMGDGNLVLTPFLEKDESYLPNGVVVRYRLCCGRRGAHGPDCRIRIAGGSGGHVPNVPRPSLPAAVSPPCDA